MRKIDNIYEKVIQFENLLKSAKKAYKGTRKNKENTEYMLNLENKLVELKQRLTLHIYTPKPHKIFHIYEPKEREISVASFEDRIVHHAVVNILEPIYEKQFIYHSYACRKSKGTHKAIFKAQEYMKKNKWYLKCDIRKYFRSINHEILLKILKKKIIDEKLNQLIKKIITNVGEKDKGLPIGNLTSQFFANLYLNELDYYIKQEIRQKYYIRYMDDFIIFAK